MLSVAVTGNIGAGKSTVARLFEDWGAARIDADAITRELQTPGTPVFAAMVRRFGTGILLPDGGLDRKRLRDIVLTDPSARDDLDALVHPAVYARIRQELERLGAAGTPIAVVEVPLLFETDSAGQFDRVVLVTAPRDQLLARLATTRSLPPETAGRFLDAQARASAVAPKSDHVIENRGSPDELRQAARAVWRELTGDA